MTQETSERVVEKSVTVSVPVERAFEVFTAFSQRVRSPHASVSLPRMGSTASRI